MRADSGAPELYLSQPPPAAAIYRDELAEEDVDGLYKFFEEKPADDFLRRISDISLVRVVLKESMPLDPKGLFGASRRRRRQEHGERVPRADAAQLLPRLERRQQRRAHHQRRLKDRRRDAHVSADAGVPAAERRAIHKGADRPACPINILHFVTQSLSIIIFAKVKKGSGKAPARAARAGAAGAPRRRNAAPDRPRALRAADGYQRAEVLLGRIHGRGTGAPFSEAQVRAWAAGLANRMWFSWVKAPTDFAAFAPVRLRLRASLRRVSHSCCCRAVASRVGSSRVLPGGPPAPAGPTVVFNVDASLLGMFGAGGPGAAAMQSMMESLRAAGAASAAAAAQPAAPLAAAAAAASAALKPMYVRFKEDVEPFREDDIVEIVKARVPDSSTIWVAGFGAALGEYAQVRRSTTEPCAAPNYTGEDSDAAGAEISEASEYD